MKVRALIEKLSEFYPEMDVTVADGFDYMFYDGEYDVALFTDDAGRTTVDIGVGGTRVK